MVANFGRVLEGWKMVLHSHAILYKHEAIPLAPDLYIFSDITLLHLGYMTG